jgi:hypothetical protein
VTNLEYSNTAPLSSARHELGLGGGLGFRLERELADCAVQFHSGMGYMDESWTSR